MTPVFPADYAAAGKAVDPDAGAAECVVFFGAGDPVRAAAGGRLEVRVGDRYMLCRVGDLRAGDVVRLGGVLRVVDRVRGD